MSILNKEIHIEKPPTEVYIIVDEKDERKLMSSFVFSSNGKAIKYAKDMIDKPYNITSTLMY